MCVSCSTICFVYMECCVLCSGGGHHCHHTPVSEVYLCLGWQTAHRTYWAQARNHCVAKGLSCYSQAEMQFIRSMIENNGICHGKASFRNYAVGAASSESQHEHLLLQYNNPNAGWSNAETVIATRLTYYIVHLFATPTVVLTNFSPLADLQDMTELECTHVA